MNGYQRVCHTSQTDEYTAASHRLHLDASSGTLFFKGPGCYLNFSALFLENVTGTEKCEFMK
jgi:hypothetical protein